MNQRIAITLAVGCAAFGTLIMLSGAFSALEQVASVDNALAELSHYASQSHDALTQRVLAKDETAQKSLAQFESGMTRRMTRLKELNTPFINSRTLAFWTATLGEKLDYRRLDADRREYASALAAAIRGPIFDEAGERRTLDLHIQLLIQTVEAIRDGVETDRRLTLARSEALFVGAASIGGLLLVFLIWRPVFVGRPDPVQIVPAPELRSDPAMSASMPSPTDTALVGWPEPHAPAS